MRCSARPAREAGDIGGWPTRHIQLIVPYPAGSGTDTAARVFAPKLGERLGQTVVIENRVGAGGKLGVELLAKSNPDGYTIGFVTSSTQALAPHLEPKPRYDVLVDFAPVGLIGNLPFVLVSSAKNGITSVKELVARAKANPGKITFGSAGVTTDTYFAGRAVLVAWPASSSRMCPTRHRRRRSRIF